MAVGQNDMIFVPADAEHFCSHCGFPLRDSQRNQRYCQQYALPGHGRCGKRYQDAQNDDGLRTRLDATQRANPYDRRTHENAIAHAWVRQHRPGFNLGPWETGQVPSQGTAVKAAAVQSTKPTHAFLLGWHPQSFLWEEEGYYDAIEMTAGGQTVADSWTVGGRKTGIRPGDRAFAYRYQDHRGLVASGTFTSGVYEGEHWDGSGRVVYYADIKWDIVLHYEDCLPIEELSAKIPEMPWNHLQGSGIEVKPEAVANLIDLWERHTSEIIFHSADEPRLLDAQDFPEGALSRVEVNRYERDPRARRACLEQWGYRCAVCNFSFEERYGLLGRDYIHVHHTLELSRVPPGYQVNPVQDLRPLCPNCHAMIHRGPGPALTVEELKRQLVPGWRPT